MNPTGERSRLKGAGTGCSAGYFQARSRPAGSGGFTLLEMLLSIALVALLLVAMNTAVFSMGELWGRGTDKRLFDQHIVAVTRYLERELRGATLPPSVRIGDTPVTAPEITPASGTSDNMLTVDLPAGSRLVTWPDRPLPDMMCSLQVREGEGLILLWHSSLETKYTEDPPRETVISSLVTALSYDYYDPNLKSWSTETALKKDSNSQPILPQRLRLTFSYDKMTHDTVISVPTATEGLPAF
jgi:prepilin-type N-terminal cleavage/methylation domain-containing protein